MKPVYLFSSLVLFLFSFQHLRAQQTTPPTSKFELGANVFFFHMDPMVSRYYGSPYSKSNRLGLGLKAAFNIIPALAITTELNYVNKNMLSEPVHSYFGDSNGPAPIGIYDEYANRNRVVFYYKNQFDIRLQLLEIPIGLRWRIMPRSKNSFILAGGAVLAVPLVSRFATSFGKPYRMEAEPGTNYTLEDGTLSIVDMKVRSSYTGVFMGVGFRRKIHKNNELEVMLQAFGTAEAVSANIVSNIRPKQRLLFDVNSPRYQLNVAYNFILHKK